MKLSKTEKALVVLIILAGIAAEVVWGCPKGSIEWEKSCSADLKPQTETVAEVQASNEKPSRHPEPAWQRGDVQAAMPQSLAEQDAKLDQERAEANAQGKKAAGLK